MYDEQGEGGSASATPPSDPTEKVDAAQEKVEQARETESQAPAPAEETAKAKTEVAEQQKDTAEQQAEHAQESEQQASDPATTPQEVAEQHTEHTEEAQQQASETQEAQQDAAQTQAKETEEVKQEAESQSKEQEAQKQESEDRKDEGQEKAEEMMEEAGVTPTTSTSSPEDQSSSEQDDDNREGGTGNGKKGTTNKEAWAAGLDIREGYGDPDGSHMMRDAAAGAAIGSLILPGVGTVIGGVVGAIVGHESAEEVRQGVEKEAEKRAQEPVDVNTPAGREAALDRMTQQEGKNGQMDPDSENKCNATAVVAGALRAGGREGLQTVMEGVNKDKDGNPIPDDKLDPATKAMMDKIKDPNSQLTQQDLNDIKDKLYDKLRDNEGDQKAEYKKDANGNVIWDNKNGVEGEPELAKGDPAGVKTSTTDNFVNNNPALKKMFDDSGQRIDHINVTGQGESQHVVLEQRDKDGNTTNVYDPYMRKDGHQVVTDPDLLAKYRQATYRNNQTGAGSR
jgi:hypothetical protein